MKENQEHKFGKIKFEFHGGKILRQTGRSAFTGLLASVAVTALWFMTMNKKSVMTLGAAILGAAVIIFILKLAYDFALEKLGVAKKLLANELFILFAVLAFLGTTICAFAPMMLFEYVYNEAAEKSLRDYAENGIVEELCLETDDGALYGWILHTGQEESAPTVLYFADSGEDAAGRVLALLEDEQKLSVFDGCNFACVDYPEYGKSEGSISEASIKNMALYAYDALLSRSDVDRLVLMGCGLGTGVANYVASERQPSGLVLMAPYAEGYDLYNSYINIFHGPLKALAGFKMKSYKYAEAVTVKPLLLASNADKTVPYESSVRLFERYKNGCNFVTVDETGHDEFWETREVLDEIKDYLEK